MTLVELLVCVVGVGCSPAPMGVTVDFVAQTIALNGGPPAKFDTAALALDRPLLTVSQGVFRNSFE